MKVKQRIMGTLLTEKELSAVEEKVKAIETITEAEVVTVLAKRSDDYLYIPTLWAAMLGLLTPVVLMFTPLWLSGNELLMLQWLVFILCAVLFRLPTLTMYLVPKHIKQWRAANLARRQFLDNNLHHTKGETGVLVFVAEAEHYVEIIVDRGVSAKIDDTQWQQIIDKFVKQLGQGDTLNGFLECLDACGVLLGEHLPPTSEHNELPNALVVL